MKRPVRNGYGWVHRGGRMFESYTADFRFVVLQLLQRGENDDLGSEKLHVYLCSD